MAPSSSTPPSTSRRQHPAASFDGAGQRRNQAPRPLTSGGASSGSVAASAAPTDTSTRRRTVSAARAKSRKSQLFRPTMSANSSVEGAQPAGRFEPWPPPARRGRWKCHQEGFSPPGQRPRPSVAKQYFRARSSICAGAPSHSVSTKPSMCSSALSARPTIAAPTPPIHIGSIASQAASPRRASRRRSSSTNCPVRSTNDSAFETRGTASH